MTAAMLPRVRSVALVLSLGLSQVAAFASSFYLFGVLADPISRDLHVPATTIFGLFSGAMLISALLTPTTGRIIHRYGAKRVFLGCLAFLGAALLTLAAADTPVLLGVAMALMGVGMSAGLYSGPNALAVEVFGDAARRPITVVSLIGGFGSTSAWILTPRVESVIGWRGACVLWAAVLLLIVCPLIGLLAPAPRPRGLERNEAEPIVWDRSMLQLAVLFCGTWFIAAGIGSNFPRLLSALGMSMKQAAATAGLLGLSAVSARLVELTLLRRSHPIVTARVASLGAAAGAGLVVMFGVGAAPGLVVLQGLANGLLSVANGVLPLTLWRPANYARRAALLNTPAKLIQTAGPVSLAMALDHGAGAALATTATISLIMCVSTFGLKREEEG